MRKGVLIFGTGGVGEMMYFYLKNDSPYKVVGFTADRKFIKGEEFLGLPIIAFEEVEKIFPPKEYKMLVAMGYAKVNKIRAEKYYATKRKGYKLISYISSKATCHCKEIGDNCIILENSSIQPFAKIGSDVIVGIGNVIGHHSIVGDHSFISSQVVIAGNVKIEPHCFIGMNSTIRNGITVARENVIGAGALIMKNTKKKNVYVGKRASVLKISSDRIKGL